MARPTRRPPVRAVAAVALGSSAVLVVVGLALGKGAVGDAVAGVGALLGIASLGLLFVYTLWTTRSRPRSPSEYDYTLVGVLFRHIDKEPPEAELVRRAGRKTLRGRDAGDS